jgi:hypothetical protein
MSSGLLRTARIDAAFCAIAVCLSIRIDAAPQQETHATADALSRIKRELQKTRTDKLKLDPQLPVATFRSTVEQRRYMLTFEEWLRKEFELTPFQRQSQEWRSKCCGIDLIGWKNALDRALQHREARRIREQIARELAQIEANKKK